ncbi:MAG: FG-GAP repeat domain-containing protein [Rubripirellula sp.]
MLSSSFVRRVTMTLLVGGLCQAAAGQTLEFEKVVLDPEIGKVCYAVTAADVDQDGDLDAVAISEREAIWYRNPDWKKHVMISDAATKDHVCIAAGQIDDDGKIDFAMGAGWPKSGGEIFWICRGDSLDQPWTVHSIGAEAWTHRMRFADVLGQGSDQLVVTPLNGADGSGIRLLAFPIPTNPAKDPWTPQVMNRSLNRAHNHWHLPGDGETADATLVASSEGLSLIQRDADAGFELTPIAAGAAGDKPNLQGSGEVKQGRLGSQVMLATIEPMHGNQVVAYLGESIEAGMNRVVLDDSFAQGHAIWCADLDGDGQDEIIAAHREPKTDGTAPGIYVYRATDSSGANWERQLLDTPMACEDVWCADFDGDSKVDILAGGRATHDVNLYLNRIPGEKP